MSWREYPLKHEPCGFKDLENIPFEQVIVLSQGAYRQAKLFAEKIGACFYYWEIELPDQGVNSSNYQRGILEEYKRLIKKIENKLLLHFEQNNR